MELNKIQTSGSWGKAADDLNQNFSKVNNAVEQVKNATTRNKGYFSSDTELKSAFPSANVGDIAYVGSAYPYQTWAWDGSAWKKKNDAGGEESVNLGDYYTKEETNEKIAEADAKLSELGSKLHSFDLIGIRLPQMVSYTLDKAVQLTQFKVGKNTDGIIRIKGRNTYAFKWNLMGLKTDSAAEIINSGNYIFGDFDETLYLAEYLADKDTSLYEYFYIQLNSGTGTGIEEQTFILDSVSATFDIAVAELSNAPQDIEALKTKLAEPVWHNMEYYNFLRFYGSGSVQRNEKFITTSTFLQSKLKGFVNRIRLYSQIAGGVEIVVANLENKKFRHYFFNLESSGVHELSVNIPIEQGEYVGYSYVEGDNLPFATNNYGHSSKFIQATEDGITANVAGFVALQYSVIPLGMSVNAYSTSDKLGSVVGTFQEGTPNLLPSNLVDIPTGRWYTFMKDDTIFSGIIKRLRVSSDIDQNITFGIGIIDQRGWAIIDEEFTLPIKAGDAWFDCNVYLAEGKRLFIKGGVSLKGETNSAFNQYGIGLLTTSEENILLVGYSVVCFGYEIEGEKKTMSLVAKSADIEQVKESVSSVETRLNTLNLDSLFLYSDNKVFKLKVDDNGNLGTIQVPSKKISIFGNSIEIHGYSDYWWADDRGMASSIKDNDYPHRIQNYLKNEYSTPTSISVYNIAEWEIAADSWSMNRLDAYLDNTDLVIIRVGENASYDSTYESRVKELITYIKSKTNAPLIWGGLFWANNNKENAAKAAVQSFGDIPFVTFSDLDQPQYKSYLGAKVLGNDGVWHTVNNSGVANHPGDEGFRVMAERFMPYVLERLGQPL